MRAMVKRRFLSSLIKPAAENSQMGMLISPVWLVNGKIDFHMRRSPAEQILQAVLASLFIAESVTQETTVDYRPKQIPIVFVFDLNKHQTSWAQHTGNFPQRLAIFLYKTEGAAAAINEIERLAFKWELGG